MKHLLAAAIFVLGVASAQQSSAAGDDWSFRFTPYVWLPSLSLDAGIGTSPQVSSDTDVLDVLDFAFLATGEARKGDWGLLFEFNYLALSDEATFLGSRVRIDTELEGVMAGAAVAYRLADTGTARVDGFAGARVWSLETSLDFRRLPAVSRTTTFVDPILGVRAEYDFGERWSVSGLAEVGGFGVGSELQWELVGRVGYRVGESTTIGVGYRHLALEFDRDRIDVEAAMSGPFLAVDFTW